MHAQNVVRAVNHSEDRFRDSEEQFYSLTTRLSSREAGAMGHSDLEQLIEKEGRALMRRLFQDHLGLRAQRENERGLTGPVVGAEGELQRSIPLSRLYTSPRLSSRTSTALKTLRRGQRGHVPNKNVCGPA